MADSNYPAVGLQVDFNDFAELNRAVDGGVEAYRRLRRAAVEATNVDGGEVDRVAQRRTRATQAAADAQVMSNRQIMAAQRGLTNFSVQQDALVLRSRQNLSRQQANEADKAAKAQATAVTRASKEIESADRQRLAEFRRMMDERVAAGRAAGVAAARADQQSYDLRKKLTAQQANETEKAQKAATASEAKGLADFRAMMDQRIAAGRAAGVQEERSAQQAFALRKRFTAQAAAEAVKANQVQAAAEERSLKDFRAMMDQRIAAGRASARAQQTLDEQTYQARRRFTAQQAAEAVRAERDQQARQRASQGQSGGGVAGGMLAGAGGRLDGFLRPLAALRNGLAQTRSAFFDVRTAVGVFLGGLIVAPLARFADSMVALEARIGFFAKSQRDVPYLFEAVYAAAQRSRAPLEAVGTLYTRLAPLADQLGKSQLQLLRVTETVQKGIAIGGASAAEAASSSQQLAQALASNRLGGDELRSLAENAPVLLGAIAKELDMNTGQFIKWAQSGKANAKVVIEALERAGPRIDALFAKFPVTIGQGLTVATNAITKFVGEVNRLTGIGAAVGSALVDFSRFIESEQAINATVAALKALGDAFQILGRATEYLVSMLPAIGVALLVVAARAAIASKAAQATAFNFALLSAAVGRSAAAMIVAQNAAAVASARLLAAGKGLFAMFGGPWGVAIIAATVAINGFNNSAKAAAESTEALKTTQDSSISALERAIAFSDAYGLSTTNLNASIATMAGVSLQGADASRKAGTAHDEAMQRAQARAMVERALTVDILRRAAAEATGEAERATNSVEGIFGLRNKRRLLNLSTGSMDPGVAAMAQREVDKVDAQIAQTMSNAAVQSSRSAQLSSLAAQTAVSRPVVARPDATGDGIGQPGPAAEKKTTAAERLAERLQREADAQNAVIQGNLALAKAYDVSETAALRQIAVTEATSRAIKHKGDIDAFVSRQLNENASEAAAQAAKDVFMLNAEIAGQNRANEAVRAGLMTSDQAQERMEIEARLRPMIAQMDGASGEAKESLRKKIIELAFAQNALNKSVKEGALIQQREGQRDEIASLEKQIELIGKSNRERAIEMALFSKRQELTRNGQINLAGSEDVIKGAGDVERTNQDLLERTHAYNDSLTLQSDLLGQIANQAQAAGDGLRNAFGDGAAALSDLLGVMTSYEAKQAEIAVARAEYARLHGEDSARLALFDRDAAYATVKNYGDMAGAAKNLFSERSRGYAILAGAEKAFRIFEFAMSAKSIAIKAAETAAKIGLFGAQAQAAAMAGAANMFATLGPAGFAAVAAMVAVLGGLGLALSGGGGGGSVPGANDMVNRQASQGAGSVLGDAQAKSESLARAMEIVAANSNKDLEFSNGMLKSLRAIESGIGAVAAALGRSLSAGGALSTDGLNLGKTGSGGATSGQTALFSILGGVAGFALTKILPGLFGSKTTRSLQDQGLQFGSQSLGGILSGGIDGQTYQQVLEQTKKKAFGITYSNKTSSSTTTADLDADFTKQVSMLIGSLRGSVLEGAKILGIDGAGAVLDAFQVNLGKLSFKDMDGAEIQEALNSIFSKLGDDLAATAIPALTNLQKAGEGAFETLARVSRNYVVLDTSLKSIGMTFGAIGVASLEAREYLIEMAGGIEALTEQTSYFAENFLTDLERMAPIQKAVTEELARLGLQGVTTKDQFKSLVLGLDLSTKSGADMYAALMALAPAFAKVIDFATEGSKAVQTARDALSKAYERESSALQSTIDKFSKLAKTLGEFADSLDAGPLSGASLTEVYDRTRRDFLGSAASAATGDADAMAALPNLGQAFLEASKQTSATLVDYQRDVATVRNATRAAQAAAENQVDIAERQLEALNASVAGLIVLNETTISVRDAIIALQAALAQQAAITPPPSTQTPTPDQPGTGGNGTTPPPATNMMADYGAYISMYGDVAAEYQRNLASAKGRALLDQLGIADAAGFGEYHYNTFGKGENRTLPMTAVPLVRTAAEAARLGGANDNTTLVGQVADLNETMGDLQRGIEAVALNTGKVARINDRWDGNGMPEVREV